MLVAISNVKVGLVSLEALCSLDSLDPFGFLDLLLPFPIIHSWFLSLSSQFSFSFQHSLFHRIFSTLLCEPFQSFSLNCIALLFFCCGFFYISLRQQERKGSSKAFGFRFFHVKQLKIYIIKSASKTSIFKSRRLTSI